MRSVKNLIIFVVVLGCAVFFSINSKVVEIQILPREFPIGTVVFHIPLFVVMLVFSVFGFFVGSFSEYFRSFRYRRAMRQKLAEVKSLNSEIKYLKNKTTTETEEILNLLK